MRKGMKKKNCVALTKPSYASKLAAAQQQKGRLTLEEKNKAEELEKCQKNSRKGRMDRKSCIQEQILDMKQ